MQKCSSTCRVQVVGFVEEGEGGAAKAVLLIRGRVASRGFAQDSVPCERCRVPWVNLQRSPEC